jgi:class 3 adenylate cyclase/tetratricopeptide (TPR) repeat protein
MEGNAQPTVPLMPPQLAARILSSRFAREGERKQVTVLFADIRGSTELIEGLDPEQALHRLEPVLEAMANAVHRYSGTVSRMQGDGIMALFGAPLAHEDHAVRACFAAHTMINAVAQLGEDCIEIRVGINSGEVVVRSIGNDLSMEYDAVGPTVHLAHRMEQLAAPQTVCLTAKTVRLAGGFIEVRPHGMYDIKGISQPLEVFELVGAAGRTRWEVRAAAHGLTRFVGREAELTALADALRRAGTSRGQLVAIAGEAGMGKSRLVHEFLGGPALEGWPLICASAMPHDRNSPYQLIVGLLRSWLNVNSRDDQAEIQKKLATAVATIGEHGTVDLAPLSSLLDLPVQGTEWKGLDPLQRRQRTHDAIRLLVLKIASASPLILLVEDLHWADSESQAVLDTVVDSLGAVRLLVIATYRPEYQNSWARQSYYSLLRLGPFETSVADTLLRNLLGNADNLRSLRRRIIEQTDGTPLFLEEMVRALVETDVLVTDSPRFRLTRSIDRVEIPDTVQAVLAARIDRLPVEDRTLLQVASVIGKDVPVVLLGAVADVSADRLHRQLAELRSLEFLYEINRSSGTEYTFKHSLTHAVTYDSMLLKHRRVLHARIMAAIEQNYPDRLDEFTERLADHALRGEVWDKAVAYCYKAGQRAIARSAHREATGFFERALEAVGHLPLDRAVIDQAIDIRLGLRVALAATADLMQIRKYLEEAEALARSIDDRRRLVPIIISKSTILSNLGALDDAVEAGLYGRTLAEQLNDEACLVSAGFALGQAYWNRGEFQKANAALSRAIEPIAGDLRKRYSGTTGTGSVLCLVSLSHNYSLIGLLEQASARSSKALEIAEETGRPYDISYAHAAKGLVRLTVGDLIGAIEHLEEALRVCRAGDIRLLFPHTVRYLSRAYALANRLGEARALLEEAIDQAKTQSLVALHAWCAAALGLTQLLSGAPDEAKEITTGAYDLARRHGYRPIEVHTSRLLGEIAADYGGAAAAACAETWFRDAAALARELGMQPELAHCHRDLGELFARIDRPVEAQAALAAAAKLYRSTGMQPYAAQVEAALAELGKGASGILAAFDVSKRVVLNLSATNINQEKEGKRQ